MVPVGGEAARLFSLSEALAMNLCFRDQPLELVTAVGTSKPSGQLDSHQQTPGSKNERIGDATDVKLSDVAHKEVSNC